MEWTENNFKILFRPEYTIAINKMCQHHLGVNATILLLSFDENEQCLKISAVNRLS